MPRAHERDLSQPGGGQAPALPHQGAQAIRRLLDPQKSGGEDWQGWAYEGFFLGAQDERGEPFLAVFNFEREHGGGQRARSEDLFPYQHGSVVETSSRP
jgi:hypothetical protein